MSRPAWRGIFSGLAAPGAARPVAAAGGAAVDPAAAAEQRLLEAADDAVAAAESFHAAYSLGAFFPPVSEARAARLRAALEACERLADRLERHAAVPRAALPPVPALRPLLRAKSPGAARGARGAAVRRLSSRIRPAAAEGGGEGGERAPAPAAAPAAADASAPAAAPASSAAVFEATFSSAPEVLPEGPGLFSGGRAAAAESAGGPAPGSGAGVDGSGSGDEQGRAEGGGERDAGDGRGSPPAAATGCLVDPLAAKPLDERPALKPALLSLLAASLLLHGARSKKLIYTIRQLLVLIVRNGLADAAAAAALAATLVAFVIPAHAVAPMPAALALDILEHMLQVGPSEAGRAQKNFRNSPRREKADAEELGDDASPAGGLDEPSAAAMPSKPLEPSIVPVLSIEVLSTTPDYFLRYAAFDCLVRCSGETASLAVRDAAFRAELIDAVVQRLLLSNDDVVQSLGILYLFENLLCANKPLLRIVMRDAGFCASMVTIFLHPQLCARNAPEMFHIVKLVVVTGSATEILQGSATELLARLAETMRQAQKSPGWCSSFKDDYETVAYRLRSMLGR